MSYLLGYFFSLAGNGFIEGRELDKFLREFVSSVNFNDVEPEVRDETFFHESYVENFAH